MIRTLTVNAFIDAFLSAQKEHNAFEEEVMDLVKKVIDDIRTNGEAALKKYVEKFDQCIPENWEVSKEQREQAWKEVSKETSEALQKAAENIRQFHARQLQQSKIMEMTEEIISGQLLQPMERVGIYVPGGTAVYPSSVLMNAIPAVLAGVEKVIMVTPARNGGQIDPILSVAADIAGVDTIYRIGGIQAIAVLAYGTETIQAVDKIVGPGNKYVAAAKALVFGDVGIDMIAGPSEVAIIADKTANPAFIAADLIAQAEHDEHARTFLFTTSQTLIEATQAELRKQCAVLPRQEIAIKSLTNQSAIVKVEDIDTAFLLANRLAPEHLEIQLHDPLSYLGKVKNAGSVFLGAYTPEALGDYFAGPNHVLPTSGTARFSSGLSVDDFIKKTTYLYYSETALKAAAPFVEHLAMKEQLAGHAQAVRKRLDTGKDE